MCHCVPYLTNGGNYRILSGIFYLYKHAHLLDWISSCEQYDHFPGGLGLVAVNRRLLYISQLSHYGSSCVIIIQNQNGSLVNNSLGSLATMVMSVIMFSPPSNTNQHLYTSQRCKQKTRPFPRGCL